MSELIDPPLTIPTGTQVVVRELICDDAGVELVPAGSVGVVIAREASRLLEQPGCRDEVNELLIRMRLEGL